MIFPDLSQFIKLELTFSQLSSPVPTIEELRLNQMFDYESDIELMLIQEAIVHSSTKT